MKDDFNTLLPIFSHLTKQSTKSPFRSVDILIPCFRRIATQANEVDREILVANGLDPTFIDEAPARIGALAYAESIWETDVQSRIRSARSWDTISVEGYEMQAQCAHTFPFAYGEEPILKARVDKIREGDGDADMVKDLLSYCIFGKEHPSYLEALHFDMTILDRCAALSEELGVALGEKQTVKATNNPIIFQRNQAYTYCKEVIDKIKGFASYVFWKDPEKLKLYQYDI